MKTKFVVALLSLFLGLISTQANAGFEEGLRAYDARQFDVAISELSPLADSGDAKAQNVLGFMYEQGYGLQADKGKAFELYSKAANSGIPFSQYRLGYLYLNGIGVARDYESAIKWFSKAAEQKVVHAMNALADMYYGGNGVESDMTKAFEWFKASAELGNNIGQYRLGLMYMSGFGVERDYVVALTWLEKAKNNGNVLAEFDYKDLAAYVNEYSGKTFVVITDVGQYISGFSDLEFRPKHIEKYMKGISPALKDSFLANKDNPYFHPANGDVGEFVADLAPNDPNGNVVIKIENSLVLLRKKGIAASNFKEFDKYYVKIRSQDNQFFGFKLGWTTKSDAISILTKAGAKFESNLAYRGSSEVPIIKITSYSGMPELSTSGSPVAYLYFVGQKLFRIQFEWKPGSKNAFGPFDAFKISDQINKKIQDQYGREPREEFPDIASNVSHYWLNNSMHISVITKAGANPYVELNYNDTSLLERGMQKMDELDSLAQKQ